jgi:hypothetical protein
VALTVLLVGKGGEGGGGGDVEEASGERGRVKEHIEKILKSNSLDWPPMEAVDWIYDVDVQHGDGLLHLLRYARMAEVVVAPRGSPATAAVLVARAAVEGVHVYTC